MQPLDKWSTANGRICLIGDAAHPPVPYIGQGAMMAMEDVGVLARLLRHHCCKGGTQPFAPTDEALAAATADYEAMRIPRVRRILGSSHTLGKTQQLGRIEVSCEWTGQAARLSVGRMLGNLWSHVPSDSELEHRAIAGFTTAGRSSPLVCC